MAHTRPLCALCALCAPLRHFVALVACLLGVVSPAVGRAEEPAGVASFVGRQASGLRGLGRVAVAADGTIDLIGAIGAGYGLTEARGAEPGGHHRAAGSLGVAAQPLRLLSGALMLDGRWEKHPDDALGSSSTFVGEPRLFARAARGVARSFAVGGQLGLWVPGGEAPSIRPDASTLDGLLLFTFAPPGRDLAVALNAGFRLDRSGVVIAAADRPRLRPGDRLTLGLSDFDAVLLGVGASKRVGRFALLGELTWDVLVGKGAPSALESPLRAGGGARYHVGDAQIELRTEIGLGQRPPSGPGDALAPSEPRLALIAGLRWSLPLQKKAPAEATPAAPPASAVPPAALAVAAGVVEGRVTSESGEPISGARVTITTKGAERTAETGKDGTFRVADVPEGPARVVVEAPGFEASTAETTVGAGAPVALGVGMKRAIKPGQLRGLVRSFSGKPLAATVRVEPLGIETKTDADGMFQVDVPPGAYQVVIAAPGHAGQRRPVQVEENGVTVLNADLRPGPP